MSDETKTVKIEIDPDLHHREPVDDRERMVWATLDTAWNLLREQALHMTIKAVRDSVKMAGGNPPSDEEIFESLRGRPDAPQSYREMAPTSPSAQAMLSAVFQTLLQEAVNTAFESIDSDPANAGH